MVDWIIELKAFKMKVLYISIFSVLVLSSCYNDEVDETFEEFPIYPEIIIETADIKTIVWNEDGTLVNDYTYTLSGETYTNTGVSLFKPSNIKAVGEILTIRHHLGFDLKYPLLNLPNQVNIHSITIPNIDKSQDVRTDEDFLIPFISGETLQVLAGGIVESSTLEPQATTVYSKNFLNTEFNQVPLGIADDKNLQRAFLRFEEVSFIAFGTSAEELLLKDYELSFNEERELYYFDSSSSRWLIQDLTKPMRTGFYAYGQIVPATITEISFEGLGSLSQVKFQTFQDEIGLNQQVIAHNHRALTYLPADLPINYKIWSLDEEVYNGELTTNQEVLKTVLTIPVNLDHIRMIDYELLDCAFNSVENAYLVLRKRDKSYLFAETTSYPMGFYQSDSEDVSFQFTSIKTYEQSPKIKLKSAEKYKLNKQILCSSFGTDFLVIDVKQTNYIFDDIFCVSDLTEKTIIGNNGIDEIALRIKNLNSGLISDEDLNMYIDAPNIASGYSLNCLDSEIGCGFSNFEMSSYEEEAGYAIKGTFEGTFWIESLNENNVGYRSLSGEFQLEAQ